LSERVTAFKAARLFLPQKTAELKPDAAAADSCRLGHMYEGLGIAKPTDATPVELPPAIVYAEAPPAAASFDFTAQLLSRLTSYWSMYNFSTLRHDNEKSCPVAIAFGPSGTWKTPTSGLAVVSAYTDRFFSRGTKEKYFELCCKSTIPIGIDDPSVQKDIESLCLDLFNGAKSGSLRKGERKPSTTFFPIA
jgi:hypothetical protein